MFLLLKDFPDKLHIILKKEAGEKGFTLKGYILNLLFNRKAQEGAAKK